MTPTPPAADASPALIKSLDSLENAPNYRRWIIALAGPATVGRVLEIGAGTGTFTADIAMGASVVAVEPDPTFLPILHQVAMKARTVRVIAGTLDDVSSEEQFDAALMINVLEHIEDDVSALRRVYELLEPGGHFFVWVPAFQLLMSGFDRSIGHHRRYRLKGLQQVATDAGFEVIESRYVNLPGWFSWLLIARLLRRPPTSQPLVRIFDRLVVPAVRGVERRIKVPFGQSVMVLARRPETPR